MKLSSVRTIGALKQCAVTAGALAWLWTTAPGAWAAAPRISDNARQQIQALLSEKAARTPAQQKLDSHLLYGIKVSRKEAIAPGVASLRSVVVPDASGKVLVDLTATVTPELLNAITQSGGTVANSFPKLNAVRAAMPLAALESLAARAEVRFIRPAIAPERDAGNITSEGDVTQTANLARRVFGADGSGVKVGVLSDSVDFLALSQASGELPPNLTVLPGQSGVPGTGEGTAMLEIVHDLAPGAELYFATAGGGEATFANNILALRAAGCDVIVDDVRYATESPFQDGVIAQAVNTVTADGALYFASAGNSGNKAHNTSGTWEGDFADGGDVTTPVDGRGGKVHMFGTNNFNVSTGQGSSLTLFWADPLGASTNDYDLFLLDPTGNTLIDSSVNAQTGTQDPFEFIMQGATNGERIVVVKVSGDPRFLHLDTGRGRLEVNTAGFGRGHSAATNAFATAAINVATAYPQPFVGGPQNPVEDFSSDGPRRVFFQADGTPITPTNFLATGGAVRQYPTIVASDGVQTSVPGFNPFFGTSAAAPHAAAIAALLKSYNRDVTPQEVRAIFTSTALDNEALGLDDTGGYGILMAFNALQAAPLPAPAPRLVISTNYVSGGNGNGIIDYNECNDLFLTIANAGRLGASNVQVSLATTNLGVFLPQPTVLYPDLPVGASATNVIPFKLSTTPDFVCGTPINLMVVLKSTELTTTNLLVLTSGTNTVFRFNSTSPIAIGNGPTLGTNSPVLVTNLFGPIEKVALSLYLTHPYDGYLQLALIGPDGTTVSLSQFNGGSGDNYGLNCAPDSFRTTFDDDAANYIYYGRPPFVGSFKPEMPLAAFVGKSGTNANGIWQLHVLDAVGSDLGILQCWSLFLTSRSCVDGGGLCPGVDLSVGMNDLPDPATVGSNLVYTITVTNHGPAVAKGVVVTHTLPGSVQFVSAAPSQGGASYSGGVVTCTLGSMAANATANIAVTVMPTAAGNIFSSANVASTDPELKPADNSVNIATVVVPPVADLSVGIADFPDPAVVGGSLTYTFSVTNNGPATATGVVMSNTLPASVRINTVDYSQGTITVAGNTILCNVGLLGKNASATATVNVTPLDYGTLYASSRVSALQTDPLLANNTFTAATTVGQSADVALTMTARPDPVVISSNLTYLITVTNRGPNMATNVVVTQVLPAGVSVVSTTLSQGNYSQNGSTLVCNLYTLAVGANASITVVVNTTRIGNLSSTATVTAAQNDPNPANNTATATSQVSTPFVEIVPAGATLVYESLSPANGSLDVGETNIIQFRLQNTGNVPNANLVATLVASGGVVPLSGPQTYGILKPVGIPGGVPVSRPFTFKTTSNNGGAVVVTLQLQDGSSNLPPALFTFPMPNVATFANTNSIIIPDNGMATNYPAVIAVSGMTGQVSQVTASISGFTHTYPHDVNLLLVSPTGVKTLLMSHAADMSAAHNLDLTFDDRAAAPLPAVGELSSGAWQPVAYPPAVAFSNPAPAGPYSASLADHNGLNPNGNWLLYVLDDSAGDAGMIANGWSLALTSVTPVNQLADVGLVATATPTAGVVGENLTYTYVISNAGPSTATGVTFSNWLPAAVTFVSATNSQGNLQTDGAAVVGNLASLAAGSVATVSVVVKPTLAAVPVGALAGSLTNLAAVSAFETDLHTGDNRVTLVSPVALPQTDVGLSLVAKPGTVLVGSNLTYTLTLTNRGPGNALNVVVTDPLPAALAFVSATASQGTVSTNGQAVLAALGDVAPGATATLTLNVVPVAAGSITNTLNVATASNDTAPANNSVLSVVTVITPAPSLVGAGATLLTKTPLASGGSISPGQTVTVSLALANVGAVDTANLVATLLPTGGITAPSAPATYGLLVHGGPAVARSFTFTAGAPANGLYVATLQLQDGATALGTVTFTFNPPVTNSFVNAGRITIPNRGTATPYVSPIAVTNLSGLVSKVSVSLHGLTHSFPSDVNLLLVSPAGRSVLLMSHAGAAYSVTNLSLTLDDAAAAALPSAAQIVAGAFRPSAYGTTPAFPYPAPAAPYNTALAALNGTDPNGTWALYVLDDSSGDAGLIDAGWTLNLTTVNPVNPAADLAVGMMASPASLFVGNDLTFTISVTNLGPDSAADVVVKDVLPAGFSFVSGSSSQGTVGNVGADVTCSLGALASGATASITLVTVPANAGTFVNTATVSGNCTDLNPVNDAATSSVTAFSPIPVRLTGQRGVDSFDLTISGQPGLSYFVQASTNLASWVSISTNTVPAGGSFNVSDPTSSAGPRFYRAVRVMP